MQTHDVAAMRPNVTVSTRGISDGIGGGWKRAEIPFPLY